jgi:hypothetical protein
MRIVRWITKVKQVYILQTDFPTLNQYQIKFILKILLDFNYRDQSYNLLEIDLQVILQLIVLNTRLHKQKQIVL